MKVPTRKLGNTGLDVSVLSIGGWQLGGPVTRGGKPYGLPDYHEGRFLHILEKAVDAGINLYETAGYYGRSEELICKHLQAHPGSMKIATKCGILSDGTFDISPASMKLAMAESLKTLNTDYVDIFQATVPRFDPAVIDEAMDTLLQFKKEGKARFIGISVRYPDETLKVIRHYPLDIIELPYNLLDTRFSKTVIPLCRKEGIGIIVKSPLNKGVLTGKLHENTRFNGDDARSTYLHRDELKKRGNWIDRFCQRFQVERSLIRETALRFVFSNPLISTAAVGVRSLGQLEENIDLFKKPLLEEKDVAAFEAFSAESEGIIKW
ncbi:MAG: aldo/keto reductase [bacterium]|nr:aldo/keto reductase [bacterium]